MNKPRIILFLPLAVFAVLVAFFWRGLSLDPNSMPSALLDKPVPKFTLPHLQNLQELRDESIFKGRARILNVWATWCDVCRIEHPFLLQLKAQGIPIIGVNYKDNSVDARRWIAQLGNPFETIIFDEDGRLGLDLGVFGAPETYVVDKEGVIRYKHIGDLNQKSWDEKIKPVYDKL